MLECDGVDVFYGHAQALHGVSFRVEEAEIVALIGANGAGKTTSLRTISGLLRPRRGAVRFRGERIDRRSVEGIVRLGIAHCPEGRHAFPGLTVLENLEMGAAAWARGGKGVKAEMSAVFELFPRLEERKNQLAWSLSGGEQQMLAIGRALMGRPKVLLLDEPSLGLAPMLVRLLFDKIREINRGGVTVLLVEQNAFMALEIAHRAYVLETGAVTLDGTTGSLRMDPRVKEAYLGG